MHATATELELYVMGALDAGRAQAVEAHCASCDRCSASLAGEASLEIAFEQVAKKASRVAAARPARAVAYGAAGLLAMAAAALLWIGHAPPSSVAAGAAGPGAGDGTASVGHSAVQDGAILDARNDALDGG